MLFNLEVTYDDGRTEQVSAGQREMAEWEARPDGCSAFEALQKSPIRYMRFMAFAALRRSGEVKKGTDYGLWSDAVELVAFAPDEVSEDESSDPTQKAQ